MGPPHFLRDETFPGCRVDAGLFFARAPPAPCFMAKKWLKNCGRAPFALQGAPSAMLHETAHYISLSRQTIPNLHRLNNPMIAAFANVLKCRLKPTTAAEVSAFTDKLSAPTANTVNR
jgi:hypothetical protein